MDQQWTNPSDTLNMESPTVTSSVFQRSQRMLGQFLTLKVKNENMPLFILCYVCGWFSLYYENAFKGV